DNAGPVHPNVMAALAAANDGYALPYGADAVTAQATAAVRDVFEAPDAAVQLVALGTAANALILATLSNPWQTIFCHRHAHIHEDECNAPEFYAAGAKLTLVEGADAKMTPETLRTALQGEETRGVHGPQRGPVSITQATERGTLYTLDELRALSDVAHASGCPVHMDGARFANACVALGCSAADMSWKAGIDAVSFGGTKNGLIAVEAAVFFDPKHAWEFELRRKRGAHLFSKHRFLAAQMLAAMTDDLWRDMATSANARCAELARGLRQMPDVSLLHDPQANIIFAHLPRATHQHLHANGAQYYVMDGDMTQGDPDERLLARFVCDWSITAAQIDAFLTLARG
ncbi:MAG: beta-eliminating lyase-related protein, partial [Pseudomonadota bacterium]